MPSPTPADKGTRLATFTALAKDFHFDAALLRLLVDSPMNDLEDFRFYFEGEWAVGSWVAATGLQGERLTINQARARRAWHSIRLACWERENGKSAAAAVELDDPLPESLLHSTREVFYARYKMRFPPHIMPADSLTSRCHREIEKRLLSVFSMWHVRTLTHQITSTRKRRKLGHELYLMDDEQGADPARSPEQYLLNLQTYLIALAMVGAARAPSDRQTTETLSTDSVDFVQIPWDVLQQYYYRAVLKSADIPFSQRLRWLEARDTTDRALWVSAFRESSRSLGSIIRDMHVSRDPHWCPPMEPMPQAPLSVPALRDVPKRDKRNKGRHKGDNRQPAKPVFAAQLKDKTKLCPAYQYANCKASGAKCDRGFHRCGKVLASGRICGMNHPAVQCRQT